MADRRAGKDRRARNLIPEPIERKANRRRGDRRESPRLPATLVVDGAEVQGELGLGGASFTTARPPAGDELTVRCALPGATLETKARVLRRTAHGARTTVHLAFGELPLDVELALAKWLDGAGKA